MPPLPDLAALAARFPGPVDAAIILGSGLGAFAETFAQAASVNTSDIPGYPQSTVPGHAGRIIVGRVGTTRVMAFQGRVHQYEGYTPEQVTLPVRIARHCGARVLIVTNASGAFTKRFGPGDLLLIDDHINLQFRNPLRGVWQQGVRCPDTSFYYDPDLCALAETVAAAERIPLRRGTLGAVLGPTYETSAEVRMLAGLGADCGCMSTVPEAILAKAEDLRVLGISCVTNWAGGISGAPLSHADVTAVAAQTSAKFTRLLTAILKQLGPTPAH